MSCGLLLSYAYMFIKRDKPNWWYGKFRRIVKSNQNDTDKTINSIEEFEKKIGSILMDPGC